MEISEQEKKKKLALLVANSTFLKVSREGLVFFVPLAHTPQLQEQIALITWLIKLNVNYDDAPHTAFCKDTLVCCFAPLR